MEIRPKVTEYVRLRVLALRRAAAAAPPEEAAAPAPAAPLHSFGNASVVLSNAMKYLPNFFARGALSKLFFCFPDPQFKPSHHRRRIVSTQLLAEYAFALREGAHLYTITDVRDLHNWMAAHAAAHPFFERVGEAELAADPCVAVMMSYTEEGKKVARNHGDKFVAVFRRVAEAEAIARAEAAGSVWDEPRVDYRYEPAPSQKEYLRSLPPSARMPGWQSVEAAAAAAAVAAAAAAVAAGSGGGGIAVDGAGQ
jgi:tRNA (guanine-N7-)-methyltransferase